MKTYLITGISSYIGKGVAKYLLESKCKVYGISRNNPLIDIESFTWICHDLYDDQIPKIDGVDCLIHCAGDGWYGKGASHYLNANCIITDYVSNYMVNSGITSCVYLSTIDVYGVNKESTISENSLIVEPEDYGLSKLYAEKIIANHSNCLVLRLPSVLGKGTHGWISNIFSLLSKGKSVSYTNIHTNSFTHPEFIAKLIVTYFNNNSSGTVLNVASNPPVESKLIIEYIKECIGSESIIIPVQHKLKKKSVIDVSYLESIVKPISVYETIDLYLRDLGDI